MRLTTLRASSASAKMGAAVLLAVGLVTMLPDAAAADSGLGGASCVDASQPWCTVTAYAPGRFDSVAHQPRLATSSSSANQQCVDAAGRETPCYDPQAGWLGSDGCYYKTVPAPAPDVQAALGGAGPGSGGWYEFVCPGIAGTGGGIRWVPGPPPGTANLPSPAALAHQAVSQLDFPSLTIRLSPSGTQLVEVPTWLWVDPGSWRPRSATAEVPGLSVTATATPSQVTFSTGDGATVTCRGPGTPWQAGTDPAAPSPTCGHTYLRSSAGVQGGVFTVTATVSWDVAWAGGGQAGAVPGLTTVSGMTVRVAEVQAVVTG